MPAELAQLAFSQNDARNPRYRCRLELHGLGILLLPLLNPIQDMKKFLLLIPIFLSALSLSSCSCWNWGIAGSYEETYQVKDHCAGYDVVREETVIDAKAGLVEVTEKQVPRYTEKTRKVYVKCPKCVRFYCLDDGCCGSSTEAARKMATAQPASGSPFMGLIPTMKDVAPE